MARPPRSPPPDPHGPRAEPHLSMPERPTGRLARRPAGAGGERRPGGGGGAPRNAEPYAAYPAHPPYERPYDARAPQDPYAAHDGAYGRHDAYAPEAGAERVPRLRSMRDGGQASRRQRTLPARLGLVLGALLLAVVAAGGAVLMLANPSQQIQARLIAAVEAQTGRRLTLEAPATFTLIPHVGVRLNGVTLSAPPGMTGPPLIRARQLDVSVRLLPLVLREIVLERLVLTDAEIALVVDATGRRNWDFAATEGAPGARLTRLAQARPDANDRGGLPPVLRDFAQNAAGAGGGSGVPLPTRGPSQARQTAEEDQAGGAGQGALRVDDLVLGDVRLVGGTVRYADLRSGLRETVTGIDARVAMRSLAGPLDISGHGTWNGERVAVETRVDTPKALLDGRATQVAVHAAATPASLRYEGSVARPGDTRLAGKLSLDASSALDLARWLGLDLPAAQGFGRTLVQGDVKMQGDRISLDIASLALGLVNGSGTVGVDLGGAKPHVSANLSLSEIDVERFTATNASADSRPDAGAGADLSAASRAWRPGGGGAEGRDAGATARQPATSIEDLLRRDTVMPDATGGARVKGFLQRQGWSNAPFDVSALTLANADARVSVARIVTPKFATGRSQLKIGLKDGALRLDIEDLRLYEGRATGFLTLDATSPPRVAANLLMEDIDVLPLLKDASAFDWLSGKGRLTLALAAVGRSEREIVETLRGRTRLTLANGALNGFDIEARLAGLARGQLSSLERAAGEQTAFSAFAASFDIERGVATTKDLKMTSRVVHVTGAGTISLPPREVDLLVRPKLIAGVGAAPGIGHAPAGAVPGGLEVPVRVAGSWDRPRVTPDLDAALKNPEQVVETIRQIGRNVDKKGLGNALDSLISGKDAAGNPQKPSEVFKKLFGGQ